ncbi:MAG: hypothetical protein KDD00_16830 [Ignavibacteriae bacterium]|nr:hypothetical protein [Ignavibacteriota bacterium]
MKKVKIAFIYLCLVLLSTSVFINCSDDNVLNTTPLLDTADFKYPFTDGSSWDYTRKFYATDIRPDSILHYFNNYPIVITGRVAILYDTVINSVLTKCFLDEFVENSITRSNRYYYINTDTALFLFARRQNGPATGLLPLKPYRKNTEAFDNTINNSGLNLLIDSLNITMKYPVVTGKEWTNYYSGGSNPLSVIKYLSFEIDYGPQNPESGMKTQLNYSYYPDFPEYIFYTKHGLLKRTWSIDNVVFSTFSNPDGIGTFDLYDQTLVNSYNIITE